MYEFFSMVLRHSWGISLVHLTTCKKRFTNSLPKLSLIALSPLETAGYQVGRTYGRTCQYSIFLYLIMVFLSAIFSREWSCPWQLGLITRCGGIYSVSNSRIFDPLSRSLGRTLSSPFDRLEVCIYDYPGWANAIECQYS